MGEGLANYGAVTIARVSPDDIRKQPEEAVRNKPGSSTPSCSLYQLLPPQLDFGRDASSQKQESQLTNAKKVSKISK